MPEISGRPITPAQVRAIHVALSRHGIDDDEYRDRLRKGWGVDSCKELTRKQASGLLRSLGVPLKNPPGTPPAQRTAGARSRTRPLPENAVQLATRAQRELIAALVDEIAWREADGFERWLEHNQGLRRVGTEHQAADVIEGLKQMVRRQRAAGAG